MRRICKVSGLAWCGLCYENLRGRGNHPAHNGGRQGPSRKERYGSMGIAKPVPATPGVASMRASGESAFASGHPVLWEYLSAAVYEDGSNRTPSSLLAFVELGLVKICLNDRDLSRTGWVSGVSLEEALIALELKLGDGSLDWRAAKPGGTGAKRR
jgi:hypothetical protein